MLYKNIFRGAIAPIRPLVNDSTTYPINRICVLQLLNVELSSYKYALADWFAPRIFYLAQYLHTECISRNDWIKCTTARLGKFRQCCHTLSIAHLCQPQTKMSNCRTSALLMSPSSACMIGPKTPKCSHFEPGERSSFTEKVESYPRKRHFL